MKVLNLQTNQQINPISIDEEIPVFSWKISSCSKRNIQQTSYQILVSSDTKSLQDNVGTIWDSGVVKSNSQHLISFQGQKLVSCQSYFWKVIIQTNLNKTIESEVAAFETAFLSPEDWKAKWIGITSKEKNTWPSKYSDIIPCPLYKHSFKLTKSIQKATIYITGLGHFELRLNGNKVGEEILEPGWTNYDKTCLYKVFDITHHLSNSDNTIGVMLGNGFYNLNEIDGRYMKQGTQRNAKVRTIKQDDPKLLVQLHITYSDGTSEMIISDESWLTAPGPIEFSCLYGGEDYDARKEFDGWDLPHYKENDLWTRASLTKAPEGVLKAENIFGNKIQRILNVKKWIMLEDGVYVADFGQNFSGWMNISIQGTRGSEIKFIPGELFDRKTGIRQELQQKPGTVQLYSYTCRGEDLENWHPRFSYTGFRYLLIKGAVPKGQSKSISENNLPELYDIKGEVIYPNIEQSGSFKCSNPNWNRIHEIINWAMISNIKSVITDCPQREKLGWLEQLHLMGPSLLYNADLQLLMIKTLNDIEEAQLSDGLVPDIAPEFAVFEGGFRDSPEWGSTSVILPWYLYHWYQDKSLLERYYPLMTKYHAYLMTKAEDHILSHGLGDWHDVGPNPPLPQNTPIPITATCMYYYDTVILAEVSKILNIKKEFTFYSHLAEEIREAFYREYFNPKSKQIGSGSQTSLATPLAVGLIRKEDREAVLNNLVNDFTEKDFHTTSGDVGLRYTLKTIAESGHSKLIANMLDQEDSPSYIYQLKQGATTLTEHWDGPTFGKSQNHFMLGHVEEWFYRHLAGIQRTYDSTSRFGDDITIQPFFAEQVDWVEASHIIPAGKINVKWKRVKSQYQLSIFLPPNCKASIILPEFKHDIIIESNIPILKREDISLISGADSEGAHFQIGSGHYQFIINKDERNVE
ncbi:family 78 glycoside hydrolase catalytic domain [Alkalihalobacillus trypoxylicola]|uniref:alpha-L-rhamnosidase n=1 Tax=Alkalihalobacillus trypoxylicola TaxID=519424 RepID=A0A162DMJ1_9BACI|nr:family 78 glycoside hydrolase catalytic domain [Alkalihalobacillus trypoxylicola]KYG30034.1 hypothetical protein AZF04_20025 [Alkalihalobacillus trypoxylicola]